jgi:hypothetical protein
MSFGVCQPHHLAGNPVCSAVPLNLHPKIDSQARKSPADYLKTSCLRQTALEVGVVGKQLILVDKLRPAGE